MMRKLLQLGAVMGVLTGVLFFVAAPMVLAAGEASVGANVTLTVCGNGVQEHGESCDGTDFGGTTCNTLGFIKGTMACTSACDFDTDNCSNTSSGSSVAPAAPAAPAEIAPVAPEPPPPPPATADATFTGHAYPASTVSLLKDAALVATTVAGPDAAFSIAMRQITPGSYQFSVQGTDPSGERSPLATFPLTLKGNTSATVSGIVIAPTIAVDHTEVTRGETLTIFGYAAPTTTVTVSIHSAIEQFLQTVTNADGTYLSNLNTSALEVGDHLAKSKALGDVGASNYGKSVGFTVTDAAAVPDATLEPTPEEPVVEVPVPPVPKEPAKPDVSRDGRVNLADFSIEMFWFQRPNPPITTDLNQDGKVNLVDLSILAFFWTG